MLSPAPSGTAVSVPGHVAMFPSWTWLSSSRGGAREDCGVVCEKLRVPDTLEKRSFAPVSSPPGAPVSSSDLFLTTEVRQR